MQDNDQLKIIQLPNSEASVENIICTLTDQINELRRINEEQANALALQKEIIQELRDEIAQLKGQKPKPTIRPSKLEGQARKPNWRKRIGPYNARMKPFLFSAWFKQGFFPNTLSTFTAQANVAVASKRLSTITSCACRTIKKVRRLGKPGQPRGKPRQKKKTVLKIHEERLIQPDGVPKDAVFKGYNRYTVQDLSIEPHNIQYKMARWQLPNGEYVTGKLPENVTGHYGPELTTFIISQYYGLRTTEHLLLDQLREYGILISAGQLNNILIENKDSYIQEAAELLPVAAELEGQVQTDDTGGRHKGQNQYTTVIGNRWFSIFTTTDSKSRINFLKLLQGRKEEYLINEDTLNYLSQVNVPNFLLGYVKLSSGKSFTSRKDWESFLNIINLGNNETRFFTEAALYASVIKNGIPKDLGVHSDDAGQFAVFVHSLCWIHEERHYRKLIMTTDESRADLQRVEEEIWGLYNDLKRYKDEPTEAFKHELEQRFDDIFQQKTSSSLLNHQLQKTHSKKSELLRVLERPNTPLHNNSSETAARAAKIKLKISGSTRSDVGQVARDTFLSLQQTCKKLAIPFIAYVRDREQGLYKIPRLAQTIRERVADSLTKAIDSPTPGLSKPPPDIFRYQLVV
jgi:hypothetical protein